MSETIAHMMADDYP